MKKRFIPTLIALVVLVLLVIYANEYETEEKLQPGEVKPVAIMGCTENDVKAISFGNDRNYNLKVVFDKESCKIVAPSEYSCDYAEAFGIARHFAELESEHYFNGTATDTSIYGFGKNAPMVKLETASGAVELTLGSKVAIGNSFYLKKENDPMVYIVPSHIKGSFYKALEDLRDRALYGEDFGKVCQITYKTASDSFKLVLDAKNSEWLIADTKFSADNVETANLINNMRNLRISTFIDSNDVSADEFEFNEPTLQISMTNENSKTYELKAGALKGTETYVTADGKLVQKVNTTKLNELRITLNDIRDKYLDIYPLSEITEIEVKDATGTVNIKKVKNAWLIDDIRVKDDDVKDFVNTLSRAKIEEYTSKEFAKDAGFADENKCPTIVLKSNDKAKKYWLGDNKGAVIYIMDDEELIMINSELDSAFNKFMHRIRTTEKIIKK